MGSCPLESGRKDVGRKLYSRERTSSSRGRRSSKLFGEGGGPWHGARPAHVHLAVSNPACVQHDANSTGSPPFPVALKCHTLLSEENLPAGSSSCGHPAPQTMRMRSPPACTTFEIRIAISVTSLCMLSIAATQLVGVGS